MADGPHTHHELSRRINPYTVPKSDHGWRGLSVDEAAKRKYYTVLHNEQVLVTALLLIPGERSIRHSHESGELSISFSSELTPSVTWHPPGVLHGPPELEVPSILEIPASFTDLESKLSEGNPEIRGLFDYMRELNAKVQELQGQIGQLRRSEPKPRVIVDILFPPFKTTVDDPAVPDKRTIVGQWDD
jgi:hypothetical protein